MHGVAKPVHGVSACSFGLSFGREQRTPAASTEDGNDGKHLRKPGLNSWRTSNLSLARIEYHYEHSHPKIWGKFRARVTAADVMSAADFRMEKSPLDGDVGHRSTVTVGTRNCNFGVST
jgi:hypothetical protein